MKGLVLLTVCASLLLVGIISSQSFASSGHSYISEWGGFDTTERDTDCLLCNDYFNIVKKTLCTSMTSFCLSIPFLSSWGTEGFEDGQFQHSTGIVVYENNVYEIGRASCRERV